MVANDFLNMDLNLTEEYGYWAFANVMAKLEAEDCYAGDLIDNYGNSAIEIELNFDSEDGTYACVHIFPVKCVVEDDEEFDNFYDCLLNEDWDSASIAFVKAFYVYVQDGEGREVLGYKDFGGTEEEDNELQYRD